MKVLHLLDEICYSGAEVMLHDAHETFAELGISGTVLATGQEVGPYASTLADRGYAVEHIPCSKSLAYFVRLFAFLRRQDFDVIHIHRERAYFYHALVARLASRAKLVRTYHDVFLQYSSSKRLIRRIQRLIARRVLGVSGVAIGDSVREVELMYFSNPCTVIYNWIDDDVFRPPSQVERDLARRRFGLSRNELVLCVVGTCNEKKRHVDVFDAVAETTSEESFVRLLHRGSGSETDSERAYVRNLGIQENVIFLPYQKDLRAIYWASDCLVLSSRWEGLGDVIIEGIACGLPAILFDGWGMKDFKPSHQRIYGYWLDPEKGRVSDAVRDFAAKSAAERSFMRQHARSFFESKFSRDTSLARLVCLYRGQSVLAYPPRSRGMCECEGAATGQGTPAASSARTCS